MVEGQKVQLPLWFSFKEKQISAVQDVVWSDMLKKDGLGYTQWEVTPEYQLKLT